MDQQNASAIQRDVEVITTHVNADFDALASMLAAAKLYPEAMLALPGAQERNLRNFYVESVCFMFNFVKVKQVPFERVKRLILVDTRRLDRIGPFAKLAEDPEVEIIAYDHHPDSDQDVRAHWQQVRKIGATVSLLCEHLREKNVELSDDEATILALGIYEDTGSFTFVSTTPEDYHAAAWLLGQGANLSVVSELITRELTAEEVGLLNDLIHGAEPLNISGVQVIVTEVSREGYFPELAALVHKFMEMENHDAVFALARMEGRVYLVARSRLHEVDAGVIAKALGGGGHPSAASATLRDMTLVEARAKLEMALHTHINPSISARELMTSPVISAPPQLLLRELPERFTRYDINVMPVVDGQDILGVITRQDVEKAVYHGLGDLAVREYMTPGVKPVAPDAPLLEVEKALLEQRFRLVPVMENGEMIGVITRTDLLNILLERPLISESIGEGEAAPQTIRHKNIANLLHERLPKPVVTILQQMGKVGDDLGEDVYLVGGSVRDLFLRSDHLDIDVVVEGDAIEFARAFAQGRDDLRLRTHKKFNTAKLLFDSGLTMDLATARLEYYMSPAALPVVEHSSVKLDLYRRDFTINTMAVRLNGRQFGLLIDFFEAMRDIKEKVIRVLHNLSFVEDPTRVFRAIRFEQRFGFRIGKLTEALIKNAIKIDAFRRLTGSRLFGELKHILEEESVTPAIERLNEFKLLRVFHPALQLTAKQLELLDQAEETLAWYRLSFIDKPLRRWLLYFLALADGLDEQQMTELCQRLGFAPKLREEITEMRAKALRCVNVLQRRAARPSQTFELLRPLGLEFQLLVMAKTSKDYAKKAVSQYLTTMVRVRPELDGQDLKAMGYLPGPLYKQILDTLLAARLDGQAQTRQDEIDLVESQFGQRKGELSY